jgi:hypothetical protein
VDVTILAIQAKVLLWTGLLCLGAGLWLGNDPLTVTWRSTLAAVVAMWVTGKLLRLVAGALSEGMAAAELAAAAQAAPATRPATRAAKRP